MAEPVMKRGGISGPKGSSLPAAAPPPPDRTKRAGFLVPVDADDNEVLERKPCRFWVSQPPPGKPRDGHGTINIKLDPPAYTWTRPLPPKRRWWKRLLGIDKPVRTPPVRVEWVRLSRVEILAVDMHEPLVYYGVRATLHEGDILRMEPSKGTSR